MAKAQLIARWGFASLVGGTVAVAVGAMIFGLLPAPNLTGQLSGNTPTSTPGTTVNVTYTGTLINQVVPGKSTDSIKDVIAFPNRPAMLVRTEEALTLWVRQDKSLKSLLEIPLDSGANRVEFLQDGSTFVVLSNKRARVFALNATITTSDSTSR
ncbi:hypothetical protein GC173_19085 [bacterium]|nr:hypothetical protein [bacterium]